MPHLFTNRPRQHNLFSHEPAGHRHFSWEILNSVLYLIGGSIFVLGSVFFMPKYSGLADSGAWIFFGGSLLYLIVTIHDLLEAVGYHRSSPHRMTYWAWLELGAAMAYLAGTSLFMIGSLFFLSRIDMVLAGSWCFILGSLLFILGATINVIQIIQAGSLFTLQLMNATAICFTLGAMIFLLASIPYLWQNLGVRDYRLLFTYVAWEYITGSVLFFVGGIFNFYRSYLAMTHYKNLEERGVV